jgi:hypothetical protein
MISKLLFVLFSVIFFVFYSCTKDLSETKDLEMKDNSEQSIQKPVFEYYIDGIQTDKNKFETVNTKSSEKYVILSKKDK